MILPFFKKTGILGINARNLLYIKPYNDKKAILLADDKLKTKAFLSTRGIPVPKLYASIQNKESLNHFDFSNLPSSFVVKPNFGFGGEGIIPIVQFQNGYWISPGGQSYTEKNLRDHIRDILDGRYSITGQNDSAFFEQLIIAHDSVGKFAFQGLPDIRVVVHNLIPVMAMLRLPTKESEGKANLHLGAVGTGIDIAKGEVTHVLHKNRIIAEVPEKGSIKGLKIPFWDDILMIAIRAQLVTNLGYLAADIALDKTHGPILLEINARAGLNVQIANLSPLRRRLERIEGLKVTTPEKGLRIAKDVFGHMIEKKTSVPSEKQVVNVEENIELIFKSGTKKISAFLNTGLERTVIDKSYARLNGLLENGEDYNAEKSTLKIKFSLAGKRVQTIADLEDVKVDPYKIIIGRRDLEGFLIAAGNQKNAEEKKINSLSFQNDYKAIDQKLIQVEEQLKLLYHLRPLNLEEEREKFFKNPSVSPQFIYPKLEFNPHELSREILNLTFDDSPLGVLFEKKSLEIQKKINLLKNRGMENFGLSSIELFGKPSTKLLAQAEAMVKNKVSFKTGFEPLFAAQAKIFFERALRKYGLHHWKVKIKENMVSDCAAGKKNHLSIRKKARFSPTRLKNLIVHEIETHVLTAENGKYQPYMIFNYGFGGYLKTQEGLAIYNVKKHGFQSPSDQFYLAAIVKATDLALKHSFVEVYDELIKIGLPREKAFKISLKLKRGLKNTSQKGAFTKDYLYFEGQLQVEKFIRSGGNLKDLYLGKFNLDDLDLIKKIPELKEPKILPGWLSKN
jgi:alpha-L-glutamate ligase-like protein/uncharacterized protein (TIGR02421 family)